MGVAANGRPLVFVIGDSISLGYGPYLERYLAPFFRYARKNGAENVMRTLGIAPGSANGGDSSQVLKYVAANAVHGEIPATD